MRSVFPLLFLLGATVADMAGAQPTDEAAAEDQCILCHGNADVWDTDTQHLFVTAEALAGDIHWQKGIKCQACHGGNSKTTNLREAHALEDGFRKIEKPTDIPDFCGHCHANAETMRRFNPAAKTNQVSEFWKSVHGRHLKDLGGAQAATCISCHPKHQMRPAKDPSSSVHPSHLLETCGNCHVEQRTALRKGVHHASGPRNELGAGTPLDCGKCHGQDAHGILPVKDPSSPVALDHQVQTCGSCHEKFLATYEVSVHGQGLRKSGLLVTAVCADCHRAHDIYYAADKRSSLHATNVATTCGKCHAFVEERLDHSVHGAGGGPGSPSPRPPPGGEGPRRPSCVDCHQGHDHPRPETAQFRLQVPHRCGNCHADYALRYGMSLHGQLTRLGYEPAAKCADCHGDHDILPVSHSTSHLATGRRAETCRQCHPKATSNFALFDPHADHHDAGRYPLLHSVYAYTEVFLYWGFGFFLLHAVLWFARSLIHTLRFGRHQRLTGAEPGVIRFAPVDRLLYVLMLVAFLGLMLTGMPLKYSGEPWAHRLANALGGFDSTSFWHRAFATLIIGTAVTHLVRLVKWGWGMHQQQMGWKSSLFGPDSPVPNWRDFRDLAGMARWFLGLDRKPRFERWTYWEKFDYWAVVVTMVLIGGSGLLLALPHLFTRFLPGSVLNVAQVLHSETALMVAGCVFIIHFFNTHLRPEKFPMDLSLFTGVISEEHLRMARPEYLERLRQEGKLEQMRTLTPPRSRLRRAVFAGFVVIVLGLLLLLASLVAYLGK